MEAPRQLHKITSAADLASFGVPDGSVGWYYYLAAAQACCSAFQRDQRSGGKAIVIAWDKPEKEATTQDENSEPKKKTSASKKKAGCSAKAYGVFKNHETFWEELSKLPVLARYAYEIIEKGGPCKCYWDIEFSIEFAAQEEAKVKSDVSLLLWSWINCARLLLCNIFTGFSEDESLRVCILDGTRAAEEADAGQDPPKKKLKFSYHVVFPDVVFESNQSKSYQVYRDDVPSFYCHFLDRKNSGDDLFQSLAHVPSESDTGAPDLSVWKDNQIFRFLSCSKRGGSTPLAFFSPTQERDLFPLLSLCDTNPLDTFLTYIPRASALGLDRLHAAYLPIQPPPVDVGPSQPAAVLPETGKKRKRQPAQQQASSSKKHQAAMSRLQEELDDERDRDGCGPDLLETFLIKYSREIQSMKKAIQELLHTWNNQNTIVDRLVRASVNLRFQCKNIGERPCIFSKEVHVSNTPLIWLDAPKHVSEGELSDYYLVYYNCQSSECRCDGVIGELHRNPDDPFAYTFGKIFPARVRTKRGPLRSRLNERQAEIRSNMILASSDHPPSLPKNKPRVDVDDRAMFEACPDDYSDDEPGTDPNGQEEEQRAEARAADQAEVNLGPASSGNPHYPMECRIRGYGWSISEQGEYGFSQMYEYMKRDMEKIFCKIESPNVIFLQMQVNPINDRIQSYNVYTHEAMSKVIKNKFYLRKNDPDEKPMPTRFFPFWTDDANIRSYKEMKFIPDVENTPPRILNLWPGFEAEKHELAAAEMSLAAQEELIRPIRKHMLYVLASQNEEHCEWMLDWMASIVQRPHVRTEVPLVISGKQGVGKGIIFDFFRSGVLGSAISSQIQNPGQDLFARFANKHVDKIFIQIDEGEGMAKFADQLKNLITTTTINYEIKGISPITAQNYINIVITTNHDRPVLIESSDRRYALFKASDVFLKDDNYYLQLANHLKRKDVARAFFDFLKARDLSNYPGNFQRSRPLTEYYLQARSASIPILPRFLSAIVNTQRYISGCAASSDGAPASDSASEANGGECSCLLLFRDFLRFQECGRFQSNMTQNIFSLKLKSVTGIARKFKRGGYLYEIDYGALRASLVQNNEYDEDAIID